MTNILFQGRKVSQTGTSDFQERKILVHGLAMHTRVSNTPANAPAIVLVHQLVVAGRYMMPTAELLAPEYRVYVPDFPGYGESDKPMQVLTVPQLADILAEWMKQLNLDRVSMLGSSFGSQIIAEFAIRYPQKLNRLILASPTFDRHARSLQKQLWRLFLDLRLEDPSGYPMQAYDYWSAGFSRIARSLDIALRDRIEDKLPLMQMPTLVVRGSKDPVVPQEWAEEVVNRLPNGKLAIIPGAGHTLNYSTPLELSRLTRAFLSQAKP